MLRLDGLGKSKKFQPLNNITFNSSVFIKQFDYICKGGLLEFKEMLGYVRELSKEVLYIESDNSVFFNRKKVGVWDKDFFYLERISFERVILQEMVDSFLGEGVYFNRPPFFSFRKLFKELCSRGLMCLLEEEREYLKGEPYIYVLEQRFLGKGNQLRIAKSHCYKFSMKLLTYYEEHKEGIDEIVSGKGNKKGTEGIFLKSDKEFFENLGEIGDGTKHWTSPEDVAFYNTKFLPKKVPPKGKVRWFRFGDKLIPERYAYPLLVISGEEFIKVLRDLWCLGKIYIRNDRRVIEAGGPRNIGGKFWEGDTVWDNMIMGRRCKCVGFLEGDFIYLLADDIEILVSQERNCEEEDKWKHKDVRRKDLIQELNILGLGFICPCKKGRYVGRKNYIDSIDESGKYDFLKKRSYYKFYKKVFDNPRFLQKGDEFEWKVK